MSGTDTWARKSRQKWCAATYAENARFVSDLGAPVVDLLAPQPGERILDLGSGDGALTARLIAMGAEVVGVDEADDMVAAARKRGIDARVVDAHALPFVGEFDAVFSNAALHWMTEPDKVLEGVRRALRPGGRFVGEMGALGNVAAITVAVLAVLKQRGVDGAAAWPWYFPTTDEYSERLAAHGFSIERMDLIPRPTQLPTGMSGWLETFAPGLFSLLPESDRPGARDEVVALLKPVLCDRSGRWTADYVRLRFAARMGPAG